MVPLRESTTLRKFHFETSTNCHFYGLESSRKYYRMLDKVDGIFIKIVAQISRGFSDQSQNDLKK